jgi:monofunctional biosynthetic peptidoglycan transglycosylase
MASGKKRKWKLWRFLLRFILVLFISSSLYAVICRWLFPPITLTQIGSVIDGYGLQRDYVGWDEISANVKLAAMASEDQRFVLHSGFDWIAMDQRMQENKKRKHKRATGAGSSTISQQTAKNVFLWQGSRWTRYVRKVPEFYFTKVAEWTWGKKRILEVYLNVIEMGPGVFGVEAASRKYFGKSARNLSRAEAAMIIACLPNPKRFTVKPMSRWVKWRYPQIMHQMDLIEGMPEIQNLLYK